MHLFCYSRIIYWNQCLECYLLYFHLRIKYLGDLDDKKVFWCDFSQKIIIYQICAPFFHISPNLLTPAWINLLDIFETFSLVVLKIYRKVTGGHHCRSTISIKLIYNFIKITLRHGCSPVTLLHIFKTPFPKNTSGRMLLCLWQFWFSLGLSHVLETKTNY